MVMLSASARNASLLNDYGSTKGANAPTALRVCLFIGDPRLGVELTGGGYTPVVVDNDDTYWTSAPEDGVMSPESVEFVFTDTPDGIATHWAFRDDATDDLWDTGQRAEQVIIPEGGASATLVCTVNYADPNDAP